MILRLTAFLVLVGLPAAAQTIDTAQAKSAFAEAKQVSDKDAGKLWGMPLYGPMLFVVPENRAVVANEPDGKGILHAQDGVWVGTLPPEIIPANTALYWQGKHWTMVMWPLPEHILPRDRLMAHELYHRLQDDLHLPANGPQNPQLDTLDGRYWLQLEWRALAVALLETGARQTEAIRDAITFRDERHRIFPAATDSERALEMNEGLAEYTGYAASAPDLASAVWRIEDDLVSPQAATFVRSFAYTSGPAYGMLLDARSPGWRKKLTAQSDLGLLLAATAGKGALPDPQQHALRYGGAALRIAETERAVATAAQQAHFRKLLIDGPTLKLTDFGKFNFSFDPNAVIPLPPAGNVNPFMEVTDVWGSLKANEGALLPLDMKSVTVAAPATTAGSHLTGPGWVLDLAPGWKVVPTGEPDRYMLAKP